MAANESRLKKSFPCSTDTDLCLRYGDTDDDETQSTSLCEKFTLLGEVHEPSVYPSQRHFDTDIFCPFSTSAALLLELHQAYHGIKSTDISSPQPLGLHRGAFATVTAYEFARHSAKLRIINVNRILSS